MKHRIAIPLIALLSALAFTTAPALGRTMHVYSSSFGSEGSGDGQFKDPVGVAVNEVALGEAGDMYVADRGNDRVERFALNSVTKVYEYASQFDGAPSHVLSSPEGVAVDNSTNALDASAGDVYVVDAGDDVIDKFSATGVYEGQLTGTCEKAGEVPPACVGSTFIAFKELHGVAVDPEGNVWVYENETKGEGEVAEFSDTGTFLKDFDTRRGANPGVAVDSHEDVYLVPGSSGVSKYEPASGTEIIEFGSGVSALAVQPSTNNVIVDHNNGIAEYGPFGEPYSEPVEAGFSGGGGFSQSDGVAVSATGTVYATELTAGSVEVFPEYPLPEVSTQAVSSLAVHSATLNGTINPEGVEITSCEFEYGTETGVYPHKEPCTHTLPLTGNAPVPVTANLTGLSPDIAYHYRLVATNTDHLTEASTDQTFTTRGPGISEERVTNVEATTVTLQATIDPNESKTTYHFEYDTTPYTSSATHGASTTTREIPPGTSPVTVSAQLKGLQPDTTYYYRVVAESEPLGAPETFDGPGKALATNAVPSTAPESCPNAQARSEQPYGQTLPDCRAYELVSPINKDDNNISYPDSRAAESGEALAYLSAGSFAEPKSALIASRYIARREQDGWSSQNISPRYTALEAEIIPPFFELLFTPDLSKGLLESQYTPLNVGEVAGFINFYVANTSNGTYQLVTTAHPPGLTPYTGNLHAPMLNSAGVSTDLSHVVFQEMGNFTEGAPETRRRHVYEWANGARAQVDVPPVGENLEADDTTGAPAWRGTYRGDEWHAVSADGSRVYFTGGEGNGEAIEEAEGQLYVRENPMSPAEGCAAPGDACTVEVSASQRNTPDPNDHTLTYEGGQDKLRPARYWDASVNGSRVFFTSRAELTNDANTGPADNTENLYEYNLEDGVLTDLTPENAEGGGVLGLVNASEDGSYVYFVAEGVLSTEANGEQESAEPGKPNLYLYHAGKLSFIATLAPATAGGNQVHTAETGGDARDWNGTQLEAAIAPTDNFGPGQHTARVSTDGTGLAFESELSLTGYDNQQAKSGECEGFYQGEFETGRCREVYLYDAATGRLHCASCSPSGARPAGPAELGGQEEGAGSGVGVVPAPFYLPRNLSKDGGRLFFQSGDALVSRDSNGLVDVYEWESRGTGACTSAAASYSSISEGCVYAISDVAGSYESHFMDASANGDDVFIATKDQLVPEVNGDSRVNAYDVRVGGGFPVSMAAPACTNADSCKPPVSPQPGVFGAPSSATFSGPGNPVPPPPSLPPAVVKLAKKAVKCPKGRTRNKHGKCVRRKSKRHKVKKSAHTNRRASS